MKHFEKDYTQLQNNAIKRILKNDVGGSAVKVYLYLCYCSNKFTGKNKTTFYKSLRVIESDTGITVKTIRKDIQMLESIGLLKVIRHGKSLTHYEIPIYFLPCPVVKTTTDLW